MATVLLNSEIGEFAKQVTGPETPALLTRISTLPVDFSSSNIRDTPSSSLTSTPAKILTNALLFT